MVPNSKERQAPKGATETFRGIISGDRCFRPAGARFSNVFLPPVPLSLHWWLAARCPSRGRLFRQACRSKFTYSRRDCPRTGTVPVIQNTSLSSACHEPGRMGRGIKGEGECGGKITDINRRTVPAGRREHSPAGTAGKSGARMSSPGGTNEGGIDQTSLPGLVDDV